MSKPVERIVITGDFLRVVSNHAGPSQSKNIAWLARLLRVPIEMAVSLPFEIVRWDNALTEAARVDKSTAQEIYKAFGYSIEPQSWAHIFSTLELPNSVEKLLVRLFAGSLVIGFELPPYLRHFFNCQDIPYIDCSISPIRFMDDLLFEISSNCSVIMDALASYRMCEDYMRLQAGSVSAAVAKDPLPRLQPNSLLLVLQNRIDKSAIVDGAFVSALDYDETLHRVTAAYNHVLIKPHPLDPRPNNLATFQGKLEDSEVTNENFYRLVSHPNLAGVAALSSSCVREAVYFGCHGHYLRADLRAPNAADGGDNSVTIDDALIMPDFWRDLLDAAGLEVTAKDALRLPCRANRFRKQLRSAWGYNEIDSDIEVKWAAINKPIDQNPTGTDTPRLKNPPLTWSYRGGKLGEIPLRGVRRALAGLLRS